MASANDLISNALGMLGVLALGDPLDGEVAADALDALNMMVESWSLDSLYIYTRQEQVYTVPAGSQSVTVGTGGNINITRPYRVEDGAFFRIGTLDYTMDKIDRVTYEGISVKNLQMPAPRYYYYDGNYPLGNLYFWQAPSANAELHLPVVTSLTQFADLVTDYQLPPGYKRLLSAGLALELAPNYRPATPDLLRVFQSASNNIRKVNAQIPRMTSPQLPMSGGAPMSNRFNILGGY